MVPPWSLLLLVASAAAVQCPDGKTCGEKTLCCELPDGSGYGCCPEHKVVSPSFPMITPEVSCSDGGCPEEYSCVDTPKGGSACCPAQGTSCQDGHHCCPSGTHCSEDGHQCVPASNLSAVICPDARSQCPTDATCCQMADQSWGCCPMPQAICCNDHLHCCPHAYVCDLSHGRCVSEKGEVPLVKKVPAMVKLIGGENVREVQCSDGSTCPDGTTCCQNTEKHYGCCPFMSAVCCNDFLHCCPSGTTCDVPHKKCLSANFEIPMYSKIPALHDRATVQCDETTMCPGTATCCRLPSGVWGCCPYEKAVCCDDHEHCCPNGYTCTGGQCQSGEQSIPWSKKLAAIKQKSGDVQCDQETACPDKTTCCRLASGEWGCCPLEQAVCCDDHEHCCPHGYTCAGGKCQSGEQSIPWSKKVPAIKQKSGDVPCDPQTSCPAQTTCCRLASGEWGCCPLEQAVCCDDHEHCCPHGYTCAGGQCQMKGQSIPWVKKIPAVKLESGDVQCDDQTACPDQTTCCRLESGEWGCCQYEQAVCCSDHLHCCPSGYTCDVAAGSCNKPASALEKATPVQPLDYVWCDLTYACHDGQTCCVGYGGSWRCCPYPQGVCCPDRIHCCPYGHICLNSGAQCSRGKPQWDMVWEEQKRRL